MIILITKKYSQHFEALNRYFKVKHFNDFDIACEYFKTLKNIDSIYPFSILSEESIQNKEIYGCLENNNDLNIPINIPVIVIKDQIEGHELTHIKNGLVDDYIAPDTEIEDLVERIRFILLQKNDEQIQLVPTVSVRESMLSYLDVTCRRTLDILFSGILLILLLPLFLLVSILIKLESKGPVFYFSYRAGDCYKIFSIIKFRTMVNNADVMLDSVKHKNQYDNGDGKAAFLKIENDPRITRLGNFLRKTSIDELPQLINVLTGDMSLIGNRPLPLYEAEKLTKDQIINRFAAPAGISGLWQVTKRGKENMSAEERIELDIKYAKSFNLWLDMKIFFKTFPALIQNSSV